MANREVSVANKQDAAQGSEYDELLSRLMDGDLDEFSMQRLLKHVGENEAMRATWQRYHVNRQLMLGANLAPPALSIADRVRDELELRGGRPVRQSAWLKQLRPLAVAASVACLGVVLGSQWQESATQQNMPSIAASAVPTVRSMPVMPLDSVGLQAIPASFEQSQTLRSPTPVPIEGLYQELARQRLELYAGHHAAAGALHTPTTLMTGTLAKAEAEAGKR